MNTDPFLEAMHKRYACKLFDPSAPVPEDLVGRILEYGRLSPSSFGLEHWHFFVIQSIEKKKALCKACFDQDAVGTASFAVVVASRRSCWFDPDGEFVAERGRRFPGTLELFIEDYRGYYNWLRENNLIDSWSRAQCYIAAANMLTGAASMGIDSCAIEGFDNSKTLELLSLDASKWQTGIVCVFGKAARPDSREKIRLEPEKVFTYV